MKRIEARIPFLVILGNNSRLASYPRSSQNSPEAPAGARFGAVAFVRRFGSHRGRHLFWRGYFCCSSGNVTDDVIQQYIENQQHDTDDAFKIDGEYSA